jgi:hypothetical protein
MKQEGRITATILPTARKFRAWMESHDRLKRIERVIRERPPALPKERLTAARIMSLKPRKAYED